MLASHVSCQKFVALFVAINSLVHFASSFHRVVSSHRFKTKHLNSQLLVPQHLDLSQQIFCNVELNGENLEAVGFDMDFTLAQARCSPEATTAL